MFEAALASRHCLVPAQVACGESRCSWVPAVTPSVNLVIIGLGPLLSTAASPAASASAAPPGYVSGAIGYGVLALAALWTMVPAAALIALGGLATPSVRAMVAGRGGVDHQGEMQGVLSAVEGLAAVFAPLPTAGLPTTGGPPLRSLPRRRGGVSSFRCCHARLVGCMQR
jgi:hypothetical protein